MHFILQIHASEYMRMHIKPQELHFVLLELFTTRERSRRWTNICNSSNRKTRDFASIRNSGECRVANTCPLHWANIWAAFVKKLKKCTKMGHAGVLERACVGWHSWTQRGGYHRAPSTTFHLTFIPMAFFLHLFLWRLYYLYLVQAHNRRHLLLKRDHRTCK